MSLTRLCDATKCGNRATFHSQYAPDQPHIDVCPLHLAWPLELAWRDTPGPDIALCIWHVRELEADHQCAPPHAPAPGMPDEC